MSKLKTLKLEKASNKLKLIQNEFGGEILTNNVLKINKFCCVQETITGYKLTSMVYGLMTEKEGNLEEISNILRTNLRSKIKEI